MTKANNGRDMRVDLSPLRSLHLSIQGAAVPEGRGLTSRSNSKEVGASSPPLFQAHWNERKF